MAKCSPLYIMGRRSDLSIGIAITNVTEIYGFNLDCSKIDRDIVNGSSHSTIIKVLDMGSIANNAINGVDVTDHHEMFFNEEDEHALA